MYDIAIVGDGIVGSLLAYELIQNGKKVVWFGSGKASSSVFSGALINPVAGKHLRINDVSLERYQFAVSYYTQLAKAFQIDVLAKHKLLFFDKVLDINVSNEFVSTVHNSFCSENDKSLVQVNDVYKVNQQVLLTALKSYNSTLSHLEILAFDTAKLNVHDEYLSYEDFQFQQIVFCEGASGFNNPLFAPAPFTLNYGNVLIAKILDLSNDYIYDLGQVRLVPCGEGLFWCGGNTMWNSIPENQLTNFESIIKDAVAKYLNILSFDIVSHQIVQRPTIAGQQPIFDSSIIDDRIWRINGLGTRGYSASPRLIQEILPFLLN